jgi:hypothetical protein
MATYVDYRSQCMSLIMHRSDNCAPRYWSGQGLCHARINALVEQEENLQQLWQVLTKNRGIFPDKRLGRTCRPMRKPSNKPHSDRKALLMRSDKRRVRIFLFPHVQAVVVKNPILSECGLFGNQYIAGQMGTDRQWRNDLDGLVQSVFALSASDTVAVPLVLATQCCGVSVGRVWQCVYCWRAFLQSYPTPPLPDVVFEQFWNVPPCSCSSPMKHIPAVACQSMRRRVMWQLYLRVAFLVESSSFTAISPCLTVEEALDWLLSDYGLCNNIRNSALQCQQTRYEQKRAQTVSQDECWLKVGCRQVDMKLLKEAFPDK